MTRVFGFILSTLLVVGLSETAFSQDVSCPNMGFTRPDVGKRKNMSFRHSGKRKRGRSSFFKSKPFKSKGGGSSFFSMKSRGSTSSKMGDHFVQAPHKPSSGNAMGFKSTKVNRGGSGKNMAFKTYKPDGKGSMNSMAFKSSRVSRGSDRSMAFRSTKMNRGGSREMAFRSSRISRSTSNSMAFKSTKIKHGTIKVTNQFAMSGSKRSRYKEMNEFSRKRTKINPFKPTDEFAYKRKKRGKVNTDAQFALKKPKKVRNGKTSMFAMSKKKRDRKSKEPTPFASNSASYMPSSRSRKREVGLWGGTIGKRSGKDRRPSQPLPDLGKEEE